MSTFLKNILNLLVTIYETQWYKSKAVKQSEQFEKNFHSSIRIGTDIRLLY